MIGAVMVIIICAVVFGLIMVASWKSGMSLMRDGAKAYRKHRERKGSR